LGAYSLCSFHIIYWSKITKIVVVIQKKRKATVAMQQFIAAKMLDGILENLKDEDFKRK